jgi:hypothetical protein
LGYTEFSVFRNESSSGHWDPGSDRRRSRANIETGGVRRVSISRDRSVDWDRVALFVGQYMQSLLYGVSPADLLTLATAIIVLGITGCLACLLPALRATKIDPIIVLRE